MTINEKWAEQLKAAALEIAEKSREIVGDLTENIDMSVSIELESDSDRITFPEITVHRRFYSHKAIKVKIDQYTMRKSDPDAPRVTVSSVCDAWHTEGLRQVCWAEKERPECTCGGDKNKCDYYGG